MNTVKIYRDVDQLITGLAHYIVKIGKATVQKHGRFNFVLSGGNSPKILYERLASEAFKDEIDWANWYFFFGDERFVPEDDARKNFNMVNDALFKPMDISQSHIFKIKTDQTPELSAKEYNEALKQYFVNDKIVFDFVLLGLGDNVHTASLFPDTEVLKDKQPAVRSVFVKEVSMDRITMNAPLINQAKHIAFLVFGKDKAEAVFHAIEDQSGTTMTYPAQLIKSKKNKVNWFLDVEAASNLTKAIDDKIKIKHKI